MTKKQPKVDESAYLLLDDIGERICVVWPWVPRELYTDENHWAYGLQSAVEVVSQLAVCSLNDALLRVPSLRRAGILRDDGTVDEVVMKRLRAKGATLVGIGDEPAA